MLIEVKNRIMHYFVDDHTGFFQGECICWHNNGMLFEHCFYVDGNLHGEYKSWFNNGVPYKHCFYVNNKQVTFDEIPLPKTDEELTLFKLKYDLQLLPVETVC